ncbi:MAG: PIN domain-containing protein [Bacteroidaceae bacterium]|nr:PIN domain-containing protein [Bacteroidaceae bacterium]
MTKFLLDTCTCISMLRNEGFVRETLRRVGVKNCYISEITVAELYFGVAKAENKKRKLEDIEKIQKLFRVIPAYSSFKEYGEIRFTLEHSGMRVDQFDLLIGATALHHQMTLVTSNIKHFNRIQGINIENWKE